MLDLSAYEGANVDSEELREFKVRVRDVAKKYTDVHGWCGEVNNALRELGIADEQKVTVQVTTKIGLVVQATVLPSMLVGKTEEQQKEVLAEAIGALSLSGSTATASIKVTPDSIEEMELIESATPDFSGMAHGSHRVMVDRTGNQYIWRRTTEGRVLHLFRVRRGVVTGQDVYVASSDLHTSLCGSIELGGYGGSIQATWTAEEDRRANCVRCNEMIRSRDLRPYYPRPPAGSM